MSPEADRCDCDDHNGQCASQKRDWFQIASAWNGSRYVSVIAFFLQAVIFGIIHAYQEPAGLAGATLSRLIFGDVVWIAGGSLWPAVIAHGLSNTYGICSLWFQAH